LSSLRRLAQRWSLTVVLVAAATVVASEPRAPATVESDFGERLRVAEERLTAGDAAAAEALFRRLVAVAPRLAEARHGLARALAARGERDEAVALLLELAAGSAGERAIDYAAEAVALAPAASAAQLAYGRTLVLNQRFAAARAPLARAAETAPGDATAYLLLGLARWECGELGAARTSLERAVELSRRDRVAVHQLGRLHLWTGRSELALPLLREAAAAAPGAVDVLVDLASALERRGELDEALAVLQRVVRLAPESEAARYGLGRLLMRRGDEPAARAELAAYERLRNARTAAQSDGERARAQLDFGWSLLASGRDADAAAHFARLPVSAESLAGLAQARARLGDAAGALAALERAVSLAPERQDLRLLLAEARRTADGEAPP
jgi:Flp pilus assembly protein TadD